MWTDSQTTQRQGWHGVYIQHQEEGKGKGRNRVGFFVSFHINAYLAPRRTQQAHHTHEHEDSSEE